MNCEVDREGIGSQTNIRMLPGAYGAYPDQRGSPCLENPIPKMSMDKSYYQATRKTNKLQEQSRSKICKSNCEFPSSNQVNELQRTWVDQHTSFSSYTHNNI